MEPRPPIDKKRPGRGLTMMYVRELVAMARGLLHPCWRDLGTLIEI